MSVISAIKSGVSASEMRNWELDELRKAANLPRLPDVPRTRMAEDIETQWRAFALGSRSAKL